MKALRFIGFVLIVLGILLCIRIIYGQYVHCVEMWTTTHKGTEFKSALEYFFAVSKGAIAISLVGGAILSSTGILLIWKGRSRHDR